MKKGKGERTAPTNGINAKADQRAAGMKSCAAEQPNTELRTFQIDGDQLEIAFRYDEDWKVWLGDYPYFEEEPRFTPSGRPWRNVIHEGCPHASHSGEACGECIHLRRQNPSDLIGVCFYEGLRQNE